MKKVFLYVLMAVLALSLAACAQPAAGEVIQSDKERETSPDVSGGDLATLRDRRSAIEAQGVRLALVHLGADEQAAAMFAKHDLADVARFSDPDKKLYAEFGFARGGAKIGHLVSLGKGFSGAFGNRGGVEKIHQPSVPPVRDDLLDRRRGRAQDEGPNRHRLQHRPTEDEGVGQV